MAIKINGVTVIDDSQNGTLSGTQSVTGNVTAGNVRTGGVVSAAGQVTGSQFNGSGAGLTSIPGANVTGTVPNATTAGTVTTAAQGNITSVGTLTSLSVSGTTTAGNVATAGTISAVGNITGAYLLGNGSQLTGIDATSIQFGTSNVRVVSSGGNVATGVAGTSNVQVVSSTGVAVAGTVSATGAITGSQFNGSGAGLTAIPAANVTGTLGVNTTGYAATVSGAAQANITSVGTLTSLSVTGNVNAGNVIATHYGSGAGLSSITGANVTGTVASATSATNATNASNVPWTGVSSRPTAVSAFTNDSGYLTSSGTIANATNATTASTANALNSANNYSIAKLTATPNNSGVSTGVTVANGDLTAYRTGGTTGVVYLSSSGSYYIFYDGSKYEFGGQAPIAVGGIVNANANGVGNIGSATGYFNTVFAKATSAQYADLAEMYAADAEYAPGTVVCFGGDQEVTVCAHESDTRVAGVISTNPSYIMNATLEGEHVAAVALTGRVPTRVVGTVRKGDLMVSAGNGAAKADNNARNGAVIGKALADFDGAEGVIEVVVGRF